MLQKQMLPSLRLGKPPSSISLVPRIEEDWTGTPWFRKPWSVEAMSSELHALL